MKLGGFLRGFVSVLALAALAVGGWLSRPWWEPLLLPAAQENGGGEAEAHAHADSQKVKLSAQAKANLGLTTAPLELTVWWRTLALPGVVAERPGRSNRAVTTTLAGVVTRIFAIPGQSVRPGETLMTLRLASEYLQNIQAQLYKTARDLEINGDEQKRLRGVADSEALFKSRLLELGYEERRLRAALDTHRQDLAARGLAGAQIQQVIEGKFLTEVAVAAPRQESDTPATFYQVEELKVHLGEPVQSGQALAYLASHEALDIEGKAFEQEAAALLKAEREGWPVQVLFHDKSDSEWPPYTEPIRIRFVSGHVDPATRLVSFFMPLTNQQRELKDAGGGVRVSWRFRPGQRVRLRVPIEKAEGVFVVPRAAVVREGPEAYVFRQSGDVFERKPVHVRFEDQDSFVLANDGSVAPGNVLAQNSAVALNRALKAKAEEGGGHGHDHHGHSHEH